MNTALALLSLTSLSGAFRAPGNGLQKRASVITDILPACAPLDARAVGQHTIAGEVCLRATGEDILLAYRLEDPYWVNMFSNEATIQMDAFSGGVSYRYLLGAGCEYSSVDHREVTCLIPVSDLLDECVEEVVPLYVAARAVGVGIDGLEAQLTTGDLETAGLDGPDYYYYVEAECSSPTTTTTTTTSPVTTEPADGTFTTTTESTASTTTTVPITTHTSNTTTHITTHTSNITTPITTCTTNTSAPITTPTTTKTPVTYLPVTEQVTKVETVCDQTTCQHIDSWTVTATEYQCPTSTVVVGGEECVYEYSTNTQWATVTEKAHVC